MKKFLKITGIILLVLIIAAGVFVGLNWKYIKDLVTGLTVNEQQLGVKRVESTETALSDVNSYMETELRPMTEEEKAAIESGELSQTAVLAQIIADAAGIDLDEMLSGEYTGEETPAPEGGGGDEQSGGEQAPANSGGGSEPQPDNGGNSGDATATKPSDNGGNSGSATESKPSGGSSSGSATTAKPADGGNSGNSTATKPADGGGSGNSGNSTASNPPAVSGSDQLVASCVSKLYNLQNQYTSQIANLAARAKAYYTEQKKTAGSAAAKSGTIAKFSGEVTSMESSCDAKVEAVLSELSSNLKAIGADTSIVGTLRESYNNEKSAQRAIYVNKYLK